MITSNRPTPTRSGERRFAGRAGLALAGAAVVATAGLLGQAAGPADAAPSAPFGTASLLQGNDIGELKDNLGELNHQETELYGAKAVSTCTHGSGFDALTGNRSLVDLSSAWTNSDGEANGRVTEAIAQTATRAEAKAAADKVVAALRACQHEPKGHWHYGRLYHNPLVNGDHVWMDRIGGHGAVTGGVAVMLQGNRFGVVEVTGAVGDGDDAIKNVVLPAEERLAG